MNAPSEAARLLARMQARSTECPATATPPAILSEAELQKHARTLVAVRSRTRLGYPADWHRQGYPCIHPAQIVQFMELVDAQVCQAYHPNNFIARQNSQHHVPWQHITWQDTIKPLLDLTPAMTTADNPYGRPSHGAQQVAHKYMQFSLARMPMDRFRIDCQQLYGYPIQHQMYGKSFVQSEVGNMWHNALNSWPLARLAHLLCVMARNPTPMVYAIRHRSMTGAVTESAALPLRTSPLNTHRIASLSMYAEEQKRHRLVSAAVLMLEQLPASEHDHAAAMLWGVCRQSKSLATVDGVLFSLLQRAEVEQAIDQPAYATHLPRLLYHLAKTRWLLLTEPDKDIWSDASAESVDSVTTEAFRWLHLQLNSDHPKSNAVMEALRRVLALPAELRAAASGLQVDVAAMDSSSQCVPTADCDAVMAVDVARYNEDTAGATWQLLVLA